MSDWQPIESAPKDGTRVLIVVGRCDRRQTVTIAKWRAYANLGECWVCELNPPLPRRDDGVLGWMPLPEGPKACPRLA